MTGMTVAELVPEISTITEHRVVDTTQFGWNGIWQATDRLHFAFDAYHSKAERDSGGKDTWVVSGVAGSHVARVDMNNNHLPDISVTLEDGRTLRRPSPMMSSATRTTACTTSGFPVRTSPTRLMAWPSMAS